MLDLILKFDNWLFTQINSQFTFTAADSFFAWITDLHKTPAFKVLVIPVVFLLFLRKFQRKGVVRFIFLILTLGINDFTGAKVKDFVERPRPKFNQELQVNLRTDAGSFSFYSNHASNMFAAATY
ncbi:MAG: phosphatase PAP2 family protein, partial [Pseudobdellovibrio sp.]